MAVGKDRGAGAPIDPRPQVRMLTSGVVKVRYMPFIVPVGVVIHNSLLKVCTFPVAHTEPEGV